MPIALASTQMSCSPCEECCLGVAKKKPTETIPIVIDWSMAIHGVKSVASVVHTIGDAKGKPLVVAPGILNIKDQGVENLTTIGVLEAGADGTDYRVTITANLNTCEGSVITLEECVLVSVKGC